MRLLVTTYLLGLLTFSSYGQTVAELVQDVTIKGDLYEQSFSAQSDNDCLARFTILDTKKGEETVFEMNIADLNHRAISFDTRKNEVTVQASTQNKRDLIRVYEDGQIDGYQNEVTVLVSGIEEARKLVDAMKEMVQQCEQKVEDNQVSVQGFTELLSYLEGNVGEVELNDEQFDQVITRDANQPAIITYQRTDRTKGEELHYTVNLADLDERSISFDTKGVAVWVTADTQGKRDLIQIQENGQLDGYQDQVALMATDIEHARRLVQAWKQLVASSESDTEFIAGNTDPGITETLDFLTEHVNPIAVNEDSYEQSLSYEKNPSNGGSGYLLTYQFTDASKGEEQTFHWNMADMHPASIQFDIKKNNVVIGVQTLSKADLIAYSEDGVLDGYTNEVTLFASSIEEARKLTQAFQHLAKKINDQPTSLELPATSSATLTFLQQRVKEITIGNERFTQNIEAQSDGPCMLLYRIVDEQEGDEVVYEWNMTDLDESSISLGTKGNAVFASLETIGKRELIEVLENGEVDDYAKTLSIRASGIEEAREIIAALKHLANLCKDSGTVRN
uniref:Uncharacterized protein n=1 Tax=Roseihalotalea indica TaxID=2867963 RepID=A0AA49GJW7_9BACT|nr:hypothetical protein K4G66_22105 [Tunicatimonas sp. TK19036]